MASSLHNIPTTPRSIHLPISIFLLSPGALRGPHGLRHRYVLVGSSSLAPPMQPPSSSPARLSSTSSILDSLPLRLRFTSRSPSDPECRGSPSRGCYQLLYPLCCHCSKTVQLLRRRLDGRPLLLLRRHSGALASRYASLSALAVSPSVGSRRGPGASSNIGTSLTNLMSLSVPVIGLRGKPFVAVRQRPHAIVSDGSR